MEVGPGDPPSDTGKFGVDVVGIAVSNCPQFGVDLTPTATVLDDQIELVVRSWSHGKLRAIMEEDAQLLHIVHSLPAKQRMSAAGIVPDHSTNRASIVRRRIGSESQVMDLCLVSKRIQHHSGLNACNFPFWIKFQNAIHVLCKIEDHGGVATLSRQTCPGTARQDGSSVLPAGVDRRDHVVVVTWNYQSDQDLAVVGRIRCIQRATAAVKTYFASNFTLQFRFQFRCLRK